METGCLALDPNAITGCVILSKLLILFVPQFPQMCDRDKSNHHLGLLWRSNDSIYVKLQKHAWSTVSATQGGDQQHHAVHKS